MTVALTAPVVSERLSATAYGPSSDQKHHRLEHSVGKEQLQYSILVTGIATW